MSTGCPTILRSALINTNRWYWSKCPCFSPFLLWYFLILPNFFVKSDFENETISSHMFLETWEKSNYLRQKLRDGFSFLGGENVWCQPCVPLSSPNLPSSSRNFVIGRPTAGDDLGGLQWSTGVIAVRLLMMFIKIIIGPPFGSLTRKIKLDAIEKIFNAESRFWKL